MHDYIVNLDNILDDMDIAYREADFSSIDGIALDGEYGKCIIVDQDLDSYHKRFTVAHEVGHFLTGTVDNQCNRYAEKIATQAGIDVLISDAKLKEARDFYGDDWDGYAQLFGVSHDTMQNKVSNF